MLDRDDNTVTAPDTNPGQSPANTDESVTEGVPMDQMLENAKARDRDGDLLDGENAVTPGADRWGSLSLLYLFPAEVFDLDFTHPHGSAAL